jgi:hypothetical protein
LRDTCGRLDIAADAHRLCLIALLAPSRLQQSEPAPAGRPSGSIAPPTLNQACPAQRRGAGARRRGVAQNGEKVKLSALRGKPVVVYFYPKDNTTRLHDRGARDPRPVAGNRRDRSRGDRGVDGRRSVAPESSRRTTRCPSCSCPIPRAKSRKSSAFPWSTAGRVASHS